MITVRPGATFAFSHPAHVVALGFGAGLAPFAPGTFGTALGWAIGWVMGSHPGVLLLAAAVGFLIGIWACQVTGRHMGVSREILPPMPWFNYGKMTDEDLEAVYAYLRSIPAIHNRVPDPIPPARATTAAN